MCEIEEGVPCGGHNEHTPPPTEWLIFQVLEPFVWLPENNEPTDGLWQRG